MNSKRVSLVLGMAVLLMVVGCASDPTEEAGTNTVRGQAAASEGKADNAAAKAKKSCGAITYEGCCDGETVRWCDGGTLRSTDCTEIPYCGWSSEYGVYDCRTSGDAEPTGTYPMPCP